MTTWLKDPSNTSITVQWAYGEMTCHTTSGCFGEDSMKNETDAKLVPQMLPLQTQPGVAIRFRVSNHMGITGAIQPFKVTEEGFRKCNTSLGVPIISNATEELIVVDKQFLSLGMNYFIVDSDENAFLKCEFGLRLNITIKTAECAKYSLNSEVCGENGNCVTKFEKVDLCFPNPCHNASCSDLGNTYKCHCKDGYGGNHCETNINECNPNPCHHGGTCRDLINDYECYCTEAHAGTNCEYSLDLFSPPLDSVTMKGKNHLHNLYLVAGTLSGAILIVIIVVAGCYCRMHETYKHLTWKQIRYRRQKDDSPGSCLDVSSVAKTRPSIDAIWEATSINYSDDLLTSPLHDSLKPKKV
ncbi:hypothetical protein ScPMuIL_017574 [Solemya velum]